MSVVTWDGKILATDRQITYSNDYRIKAIKIFLVKAKIGNFIITGVGRTNDLFKFVKWAENNFYESHTPKISNESTLIRLSKKEGIEEYIDNLFFKYNKNVPMAWGSGSLVAMGALLSGKSATDAVKITSKIISSCGLGIDSFKLSDL